MSKMTPGSADQTGETTGPLGASGTLSPPRPAVPDDLRDGSAAGSRMDALVAWTAAHPRVPLLVALILAVVVRAYLVVRTNAMLDGDEALVGIQAERILHGQYPTYFYAQPYMGSLEAYLAAALFRLFGPSAWALRTVPIALSLLLVYLTWRLARALLPSTSRAAPLLAGLAALFAAAPPLYDAVAELRTWGGQIELYVITVALLLVTVELARRLWAGAGAFELAWRWALLGVLAGLGIWINPLVSYALLTCTLWLLLPLLVRTFPRLAARIPVLAGWLPLAGSGEPGAATNTSGAGALMPTLALLPGLAIGGLPAWIYAVHHSAENLLVYLQQPSVSPAVSGAARHGRLFLGAAITARYATCVAPRVLAGGLPAETRALLPLRLALLLPPLAAVVCAVWLAWRRSARPLLVGLPLLYAGVVTAVFCLGTSAWGATKDCALDYAGRYAVPLALVEPLLLLALFALPAVWTALGALGPRSAQMTSGMPLADVPQPSGAPGAPVAPRSRRQWGTLALLVLLAGGILQLGTYAFVNPATTFQSPYFRRVALDQSELLDYLRSHDIHYAWANHWVGNIVTFETNGQTTCADYYDQVVQGGLRRPPGTLEAVSRAERPSFIITLADPYPLLARELDAQHIPYTIAVLKRSGVTVITPARTVDPASVVPGLGQDYPY
jgi:hypothetical protein